MGIKLKKTRLPLTKSSVVPLDRDITKVLGEFFGRNIQNRTAETRETKDGTPESVITIREGNKRYEYHIDELSIDEVKKILSIPDKEGAINLGRQAGRMLLTLIVIATDQSKKGQYKITGEFRISDIIDLWEVSDGTKTRRAIKDLLSSLYSSSFAKFVELGDKDSDYTIARPIPTISRHEREGEETIYRFELNEEAIGYETAQWIRTGKMPPKYLGVQAKKEISEKEQNTFYINFRERLRLVGKKGEPETTTTVKADMLLVEWFKFDKAKLERRTFCKKAILESLEKAKQEGELISFKYELPENKTWKKTWEVTIIKRNRE